MSTMETRSNGKPDFVTTPQKHYTTFPPYHLTIFPTFKKRMYLRLGENPGNISVYVWNHLLSVGPLHTTSSEPGTENSRNPLPDNMGGPVAWDRKHVGLTRCLHGRHNNTNKTPFPPTFPKTLCTCRIIFPTQQCNNIQLFYTMHKVNTTVNPWDITHF